MSAYDGLDTETIFDFETLSQEPVDGVVVSMAMMNYNANRFVDNPYTYQELLDKCHYIKFDVEDQVKNYSRKIQKDTLEWWSQQNKEAQAKLAPSADDKPISELYSFFVLNKAHNSKKVYTRRNTFDPVFISSLMKATGNPEPYPWWDVRDTISYIEGLVYPQEIKTNFIPEGLEEHFVIHDPSHDITMDVMRIQAIVQAVTAF